MHRTEGANHSGNLFVDGPPGTTVGADILNAIQEELAYAIEQSGGTLKTAATETRQQFKTAIDALADTRITSQFPGELDTNLPLTLPGLVIRPKFEWHDADEIHIGPGKYHHQGTDEQLITWDSQLTYQFTALAATDWSYLYLDDSAIQTLGSNVITAAEFIDSIVEPAWSNAKHGWYNGLDRCISAVFTDGGSNILEFWHEAGLVKYGVSIENQANIDNDAAWTDVTLTIPKFCTMGLVEVRGTSPTVNVSNILLRVNGSGDNGHQMVFLNARDGAGIQVSPAITDSVQKIELMSDANNDNTMGLSTAGWYFPIGM